MNSIISFEIQSDAPAETASFYTDVFGWHIERDTHMPIEYFRITTDGIRGAILKRPAPVPAPRSGTNAYVCSMEVADFDAVAERILAKGGQVALAKFAVPGMCWRGYFIDPAGNTFGLFQSDAGAK